MSNGLGNPPGTVSKIHWHFTGGPKWNERKNCQQRRPKPTGEAYDALLSILKTRQLRLGQYREVVHVVVPKLRRFNRKTRQVEDQTNVVVERRSAPVCCLSDIPVAHLSYHAGRYGKIAIGFHRDATVRQGFNPVFYTLNDSSVLRSLDDGFADLDEIGDESVWAAARQVGSQIEELECKHGHAVDLTTGLTYDITSSVEDIGDVVAKAHKRLRLFLAYIKTFNQREFSTIYCEREWRSTRAFSFTVEDIAMIVLPKRNGSQSLFDHFVAEAAPSIGIPRSIPVVPWEDLIEH